MSTCFVYASKNKLFFLAQLAALTHELKIAQVAGAAQCCTKVPTPRIPRPANLGNLEEAMQIPGANAHEIYQTFLVRGFFFL